MVEAGGTATQSGIFYQNTIAALYLGELLDLRTPVGKPRIHSVRVEAPDHIDDIVVTYDDHSTLFIQAKEKLALNGKPWKRFWESLRQQSANLRTDRDQFLLTLGEVRGSMEVLRETVARAQGKETFEEWRAALNESQQRTADLIVEALAVPRIEVLQVLKRTRIEFRSIETAESTGARDAMPDSSESPTALHDRLRGICGGGARVRQTFRAADLSELLLV